MEKISIIVAVYNVEKYLPRCINSILNQTYTNLEIILVDDGSTDGTGKICDEFKKKDERIVVIHQNNRGVSAARNEGLKHATAKLIGFVDSDDYIESNMYEMMSKALDENDAQIAICGYNHVNFEGRIIDTTCSKRMQDVITFDREELIKTYICDDEDFHIYNSVWSRLVRTEVVEKIKFPEGKISEDVDYTMKTFLGCSRAVFVNKPLYNYIVNREGSIMNSLENLATRRFDDELPFWKEQTRLLKEEKLDSLSLLSEYYLYKRELYYYIDFKRRKMNADGKRLADMIRNESDHVNEVYSLCEASKGDSARMKLFLFSPELFYFIMNLYERYIVPMRQ